MPISYHIRPDGIVHTRASGIVTSEQYAAHPFRLVRDPEVLRPHRELFDARRLVDLRLSMQDVRTAARLPGPVADLLSGARIAVLVVTPDSYGLGRAFQTLAEPAGAHVLVTRHLDEAIAFLTG